ncbi:MAG: hypothetical protein ABWY36_01275 [Leifsonia sp.]
MSTVNPDDRADAESTAVPAVPVIPRDEIVETEQVDAVVRRSPRYLRFMAVGAAAGILVALILTVAFPANAEFSSGQVFGFLLLLCGTVGLTIGAVVALVLDRMLAKRARRVTAEHSVTHPAD